MDVLARDLSAPAAQTDGLRFGDLFAWLSSSLSNLSRSSLEPAAAARCRRTGRTSDEVCCPGASRWPLRSALRTSRRASLARMRIATSRRSMRPASPLSCWRRPMARARAARAEIGAMLACDTFVRLVAAYLSSRAARSRRSSRPLAERWISGLLYRLELQTRQTGATMRDYACTLLAAVIGTNGAAFLQIGDGAMVIADGGPAGGTSSGRSTASSPTPPNFITSDGARQAWTSRRARAGRRDRAVHRWPREPGAAQGDADRARAVLRQHVPLGAQVAASGVDDALSRALDDYLSSPRSTSAPTTTRR